MKVTLRWFEEQVVIATYPEIEVSTDDYPELTEQIYAYKNAKTDEAKRAALNDLEHKLKDLCIDGVPVFDLLGPYDQDPYATYVADVRDAGFIADSEDNKYWIF